MTDKLSMADLEDKIMKCWNVTEDIETLYRGVGDVGMTEDQIMNILVGMKQLYELKFDELFKTYERVIKQNREESKRK